jgi:two-component system, cell cycle sensor histidine kinase and response regulator CckA
MEARLRERQQGRSERYEVRLVRKDGRRVWCEVSGTPYRDAAGRVVGTIGAMTEVTARREAQEAQARAAVDLVESLSLLQATLESTADGLLVVDNAGRLTSWNRRFVEMWRLDEHDVASRDGNRLLARVMPQVRDPDEWAASVLALRGSNDETFDVVEFVDGRIFERYSRPQRVHGRTVGRVWSFRDVTDRARAEEALRHAQKMNAVGRLAGGVAHDFNNILTVIRNNAELALLGLAEPHPARGDLDEIVAAADRATALTRQLLAFGRKQVARPYVLDLNAAVTEAERLLRRLLPANITIVTRLCAEAPRVVADPGQLEQVLMNLAINARDAMPRGGTLALATSVVAADGRPWVTLAVADTGHGMDAKTRARAFEPFFTTKGPGQGTGLGLATVYGIVEQSGGRIALESEPGAGATFTVSLPAAPAGAADGAPVRRSSGPLTHEPRGGAPATILLVEDEDAVRLALRRTLEYRGYRVVEARHGAEALRLFERHTPAPDLVLTDVVMPEMGGRELVETLRERHPALRVLFVSGYADWDSAPAALGDGRTDFLPKPSPTDVVLAKVAELLSR